MDSRAVLVTLLLVVGIAASATPVTAQIAPGATQSAAQIANVSGTVEQNGAPVSGAEVKLSGPAVLATQSDAHGAFTFAGVPWGTYRIDVSSALGTISRTNVVVSNDSTIAIEYEPSANVKTIGRVSTSDSGAHINVTSSSIMSVSPSDAVFNGVTTWTQLLAQVPGVAVSGYSFGGASLAGSVFGAPQAPMALSLNGALPYETSTTLDGMPLQGTSGNEAFVNVGGGVDLSMLPMNVFDAADVVRGPGANAPSIVDSIGGSFVLHPPGKVQKNQFQFSASNDPYGGIVSNAKASLRLGNLSATLVYGINDSPGPLGTTTVTQGNNSPTFINGQAVAAPVNSYGTTPGIPYCYCSLTTSLLVGQQPTSSAWSAQSGAVSLSYDISPTITADVFYGGGITRQGSTSPYIPLSFAPDASYSGSIPASPPGVTNYSTLLLGNVSFNTQSASLWEEKVTAFLGRGVLRIAALQFNAYDSSQDQPDLDGEFPLWGSACLGTSAASAACPMGGSVTDYNGMPQNVLFGQSSENYATWSNNRDLLASYALQIGSASSVGVSYLTSYYNDPYAITTYDTGVPSYAQSQGSDVAEQTNEWRVYANTQVAKLALGLSWYFARGTFHVPTPVDPSTSTDAIFPYNAPRFGAVWQASPNIAIRGSAGGGFALPQLYNLTGYSLAEYDGAYNETIANLALKPEETFGFDIGTDVRFRRNTVLALDLYRTNLYGQFYNATTVATYNGLPLYLSQNGNLGTSRYEGLNLDVRHDVPAGMTWHATLGFTRGYVTSVPPGFYDNPSIPCTLCSNQYVVPGANYNGAYSATVPYAGASAQVGYHWKRGHYVDVLSTYYGSNNIYNTAHAFVEVDGHAGLMLSKNFSLTATFRNLTGVLDQSIQTLSPSYAIPTVAGSTPAYPGAAFAEPFGPRAVIVTAGIKL